MLEAINTAYYDIILSLNSVLTSSSSGYTSLKEPQVDNLAEN